MAPKNIVICCDGTGNKFGLQNSNVVKLYACLAVGAEQFAYYHPGLGTIGSPNQNGPLGRKWTMLLGLAFGRGFRDNLADAYRFLMQHYADGDRVYLFGFSRGAYTVRALTGALSLYGLLCRGNEGHLPYLLENFSQASKDAYRAEKTSLGVTDLATAFKETFSREIPIHFVGIWDTVSSVGWAYDPVKLLFDGQNPLIRKGRHAISVDERRGSFHDLPWGEPLPPDKTPVLNGEQQDIVQVWFAGVHSDVGGGYDQTECAPALSALKWILAEAELDGLKISDEKRRAVLGEQCDGFEYIRKYNRPPKGPRHSIHDSLNFWWRIVEAIPHVYFDENGKKHWKLWPGPISRKIPHDALLHPSLLEHLEYKDEYRPENLDPKRIQSFAEAPIPHILPEASERLAEQGFGVYRIPGHSDQAAHAKPERRMHKAAVLLIGAGLASLLRLSLIVARGSHPRP